MSVNCTTTTTVPIAVYYRNPNQNQNQNQNRNNMNWRNQPQSNSMGGGSLILVSGGMGLAQGLGWNMTTYVPTTLHFQFCWFIGAIVGAIVAAPLITILHKKFYFILSGLLVLAGGIIFTSVPYNFDAIIAARYINGIATGFATVPFLIHASEISAQSYRAVCLSIEQYSIIFGMTIQVIYASQWSYYTDFPANRVHGILDIVFGVLAIVFSFAIIESPIFFLRKCNDDAALECLRRRQIPQTVTESTKVVLEELKLYVLVNENLGFAQSFMLGLMPLFKLCLYRGMVALSFSLPLSGAVQLASFISEGYANNWVLILYAVLRLLGAFFTVWLLEGLGRKLISMMMLLFSTGMIVGIGIIFSDNSNIYSSYEMSIICTLSLLYQFFAGMFSPSSSTYLGEAFPLLVKPYMIAIALLVENAIHIIIITTFFFTTYNMYVFAITVAVISFALFLYFGASIPETRNTPLKEAQDRFNVLLSFKYY